MPPASGGSVNAVFSTLSPSLSCGFLVPFRTDSRRQGLQPAEKCHDLPYVSVGHRSVVVPLSVPSGHTGVSHTILHDPKQFPVRLTGWIDNELGRMRIEACAVVAVRTGVAMAAGASILKYLHTGQ